MKEQQRHNNAIAHPLPQLFDDLRAVDFLSFPMFLDHPSRAGNGTAINAVLTTDVPDMFQHKKTYRSRVDRGTTRSGMVSFSERLKSLISLPLFYHLWRFWPISILFTKSWFVALATYGRCLPPYAEFFQFLLLWQTASDFPTRKINGTWNKYRPWRLLTLLTDWWLVTISLQWMILTVRDPSWQDEDKNPKAHCGIIHSNPIGEKTKGGYMMQHDEAQKNAEITKRASPVWSWFIRPLWIEISRP